MHLQYLLHFDASAPEDTTESLLDSIKHAGAVVSSYIPDQTLLVIAQPERVEALKKIEGLSMFASASQQALKAIQVLHWQL